VQIILFNNVVKIFFIPGIHRKSLNFLVNIDNVSADLRKSKFVAIYYKLIDQVPYFDPHLSSP